MGKRGMRLGKVAAEDDQGLMGGEDLGLGEGGATEGPV